MARYACCKHCEHDVTAHRDGHEDGCQSPPGFMAYMLRVAPHSLALYACVSVPFGEEAPDAA